MNDLSHIEEHMEVVDTEGNSVGTVDKVEGGRIKLTRSDSSDGQHHYIDAEDVESVEDGMVTVSGEAYADEDDDDTEMGIDQMDQAGSESGYAQSDYGQGGQSDSDSDMTDGPTRQRTM